MVPTKERIKKDVVDELYWDPAVDASDVTVEVSDSTVTLKGTVPTYTARNAAALDAWKIGGIKDVENLLTVHFPTTYTVPTDQEIKQEVEDRLTWNPDVYSVDIDVSVTGGIVRLEGTVDEYWKRWKAEDLISDARGVVNVENHLAVVPTQSYLDQDIARDIEAALERTLYVDADKITVKVENGKVTLTGALPTYYARTRAYNAALRTAGVVEVDNRIAIV